MKDANMLSKQHSIGSIVLTSMGKGKKIRLKEKKIVETKERKKTQRFYSKLVQNTEAHSLSYLTHDLNLSRSNQTLTHKPHFKSCLLGHGHLPFLTVLKMCLKQYTFKFCFLLHVISTSILPIIFKIFK